MSLPEKVKLHRYQYIPRKLSIQTKNKKYEYADGSVTYVNYLCDYIKSRLPMIQLGIEMEPDALADIYNDVSNDDDPILTFDLDEEKYDHETEKLLDTKKFLSGEFSIIPARDRTAYELATDPASTEALNNSLKSRQQFECYLVRMEPVDWFNKAYENMFETVSTPEILQTVFQVRNIPAKVVVASPPVRQSNIENLNIPLDTLIGNINELNTKYGIYEDKPIVFYDYNKLYCISRKNPNITIKNALDYGTVTFELPNPGETGAMLTGSGNEADTKTHWFRIDKEPDVGDQGTKETHAKASTIMSVSSKGKIGKDTLDPNSTATHYVYQKNDLSREQYLNETMIRDPLTVVSSNAQASVLAPYKDYIFDLGSTFENSKLNGKIYRLIAWSLAVQRDGKERYVSELSIVLFKPRD